ncbi:MAG: peptide chain release factor N(5)-glutamine methyltransferase [Thermomicrobiales bacterium]
MDDDAAENQARALLAASAGNALRTARLRLSQGRSSSPALDADVLLRHVLGIDRTALFARRQQPLTKEQRQRYQALIEARLQGVPVAYLTGIREFMGYPFTVNPDVLIPRPETEILVEWALQWIAARLDATVVDVGTGSGAIALSLAAILGPDWPGRVIASDVSSRALAVAAANRDALGLTNKVALVQGFLLESLAQPVDLILANLPYLRPDQVVANPDLAAEPRLAFDGGEGGMMLIAALLRDAPRVLRTGGTIGLEIDPGQASTVTALAQSSFPSADITLLRDLAGLHRHVIIQIPDR